MERERKAEALPALLREAAELGPGWRGVRRSVGPEERSALADRIEAAGGQAPFHLRRETEWVRRQAKLFEAGDYPDRQTHIEASDLARLAENYVSPAPVLIEHSDSPLHLGYLTDVRAEGAELLGEVALTREANELIERDEATALSLGLTHELDGILEVSLVRSPRVASARLFSTDRGPRLVVPMEDRSKAARATVERLISEGRLVPAQAEFATALLSGPATVHFGEGLRPVRELVLALVERTVPHRWFSEEAPDAPAAAPEIDSEKADFYRRHFPDVSLSEIARRVGA